jgi:hypothetical protein
MSFSASYDRTTKIVSSIVCLGFLAMNFAVHSIALICLSLLIMFLGYAYSPRRYALDGRAILVTRLVGTMRIPLDDLREARKATPDDFRGCIRLWGSGGLFGYYGLFSTTKLGKSTWYVTNRSNAVVLITAAKTILFSPDDPSGFLATIRSVAPISAPLVAPLSGQSRSLGSMGKMIAVAAAIAAVGVAAIAIVYSPGVPSYTLTTETLTIHDRFYPVTLRASSVDVRHIRIVDLSVDAEWRPTGRTNGFANAHYRSGWFRVASGQKVRLYQAAGRLVVLLPPKGDGAPVLYQAMDPDKFVDEILMAWSARAQSGAKAGKTCPECQGAMEEGFIPDGLGALNAAKPCEWYEGELKKSFWFGVKTIGKIHREVRSYRCTGCGYKESYAD